MGPLHVRFAVADGGRRSKPPAPIQSRLSSFRAVPSRWKGRLNLGGFNAESPRMRIFGDTAVL